MSFSKSGQAPSSLTMGCLPQISVEKKTSWLAPPCNKQRDPCFSMPALPQPLFTGKRVSYESMGPKIISHWAFSVWSLLKSAVFRNKLMNCCLVLYNIHICISGPISTDMLFGLWKIREVIESRHQT